MNFLTSQQLQTYFRERRDLQNYPENFRLRIHRSLSWLKKAENTEDLDTKLISLWISFNAAYARELEDSTGRDRATFNEFFTWNLCL